MPNKTLHMVADNTINSVAYSYFRQSVSQLNPCADRLFSLGALHTHWTLSQNPLAPKTHLPTPTHPHTHTPNPHPLPPCRCHC